MCACLECAVLIGCTTCSANPRRSASHAGRQRRARVGRAEPGEKAILLQSIANDIILPTHPLSHFTSNLHHCISHSDQDPPGGQTLRRDVICGRPLKMLVFMTVLSTNLERMRTIFHYVKGMHIYIKILVVGSICSLAGIINMISHSKNG